MLTSRPVWTLALVLFAGVRATVAQGQAVPPVVTAFPPCPATIWPTAPLCPPMRPGCYPGYPGYPGYGGYGLGGFYGGFGGGVVPVPAPYPVSVPAPAQDSGGYLDSPRSVISTVQVPSASGAAPVFIDVIRGERGPSQQLPFIPPKPKTRKAEAEETPTSSLAKVDPTPAQPTPAAQFPGARIPADASPPRLVEYLAHDDRGLQVQAVKSLLQLGAEGRAQLAGAARSINPRVRAMALWSLGHQDATSDEIALIIAGMKDEDPGVRQQAVRAAGGLNATVESTREPDGAVSKALLAALSDSDDEVRFAASEAVADLGPSILPVLVETLGSDKESIRDAAGRALIRIGSPAVAPLAKALSSTKPHVRFWAAYSLGELGPPAEGALPSLQRMAQADPDSNVRYYALAAVRKLAR